ncbi:MAG: MraY family glycosyltransferase, partial [Acidimicrobiales bacterium]
MAVILVVSFVLTAVVTPLAARLARRFGVVDHPGPLKVQTSPVPYLGGIAVAAGLAIGPALHRPTSLVPLGLALLLGLADDIVDLSSTVRLACELAIGIVVASIVPIGLPFPVGLVAVAAATVLLINGVNLIDGLDGLAAGVAAASAAGLAWVVDGTDTATAVALTGSLLAFLVYNHAPARIYLGDGGSYMIGTALAILLSACWREGQPTATSLAALCMVAYPVAEVTFAVVRRGRARLPLLQGDRGHVYDQLVARGWSVSRTSMDCAGFQALLSVTGMVASRLSGRLAGLVVVGTVGLLLAAGGAGGFLSPAYRSVGDD